LGRLAYYADAEIRRLEKQTGKPWYELPPRMPLDAEALPPLPVALQEARRREAARLKEAFSHVPFYAKRAAAAEANGENYWMRLAASYTPAHLRP
jgi:hypothetical protein